MKFIEDKLSYLNIGAVSRRFVKRSLHCALTCLESLPCFSFNLAAFPDNNDKLICEHLPSDKHNNSEKLIPSNTFHHFSIWVGKQDFIDTFLGAELFSFIVKTSGSLACCAPGSLMTVWRQPEAPFKCIRPIPFELRPSQFSLRAASKGD